MPNEILAEICTHASNGDDHQSGCRDGKSWLQAVRLTCQQLHPPATTEFGKRFLTNLPVMAARGSLETLLKICKHPFLGPQVRKISMFGCRLDRNLLFSLRRRLDDSIREGDSQEIREARTRLQAFMNLLEDEVELEQREGIFHLLVKALRTIRGNRHSVGLAVFNFPYTYSCPQMLGYQEAVDQISGDSESAIEDILTRDGVRSSFDTLFSAAARSECRVDSLQLEGHHVWCETDFPQRNLDNSFCHHTPQVFLNMKVFDLNVNTKLFMNDFDGLVGSFLSPTKNLEILHFYPDGDLGDNVKSFGKSFRRAIKPLQSDRLHYTDLSSAVCLQVDLVSFLDRHKSTLKKLRLSDIVLEGSWEEVMLWIRDNCSLTHSYVDSVSEYDKDGHKVEWVGDDEFPSDLSRLDEFLEQRRKRQAELEAED